MRLQSLVESITIEKKKALCEVAAMRISKHISFNAEKSIPLALYVHRSGIPYERLSPTSSCIIFDIYEDDPHWQFIGPALEQIDALCLSTTIFTKQELRDAEWLTLRSKWHNGYPQPESARGYLSMTYDDSHLCRECGAGLVQQDSFRLTKAPKWGTRHFFSLNWVSDELFVDDTARNILESSGLTGFHFLPVKNKLGTEEYSGVHQLAIEALTRPGVITGGRDIDDTYTCAACGEQKYHPTGIGMHVFRREALEGMPDICRTYENWGCGADRLILISQRMYQTIVDNHLERSLVFAPIQLID